MLVAQDSLSAGVTSALVLLALGLAAIGIYGVLSYTVLLRRSELGIRLAIGASPVVLFTQVLRDSLLPMFIGLATGLIVLGLIQRWLQDSTFSLHISVSSWLTSAALIAALTAATTLLSVWKVITKPPIYSVRNA